MCGRSGALRLELALECFGIERAIIIVGSINDRFGSFYFQKVLVRHDHSILTRELERLSHTISLQLLRIEEANLALGKIQLNGVLSKIVHSQNSHECGN